MIAVTEFTVIYFYALLVLGDPIQQTAAGLTALAAPRVLSASGIRMRHRHDSTALSSRKPANRRKSTADSLHKAVYQENSYDSFSDANFGFLDWSTLGYLQ